MKIELKIIYFVFDFMIVFDKLGIKNDVAHLKSERSLSTGEFIKAYSITEAENFLTRTLA